MPAFGIDFGTTNSAVAVLRDEGAETIGIDSPPAEWRRFGYHQVLPSVFGYNRARELLFGWAAKEAANEAKIEAVKRLFATENHVTVNGESFLVDEVATMLFAHMKRMVAQQSSLDLDQAVVTIPANSRGRARQRTKVCAGMGGINVLALINEPTAAALAATRRSREDHSVMVVDWGGGTLDVTVLEVVDGIFMEQTSSGKQRCGGMDFDARLMRYLAETTPGSSKWRRSERDELRLEVEKAKIILSEWNEVNIPLPGGTVRRLTRTEFDRQTADIVDQVQVLMEKCLQDVMNMRGTVDTLVLVGGTCKIPAVQTRIKDVIDLPPVSGLDPLTAIAEGAAIASGIMQGHLPDYGLFVSTEHALGTVSLTGAGTLQFSPIIPRGNKLPAERAETFSPVVDDQTSIKFTVIEGDPERPLHDEANVILAEQEILIPNPGPMDEVSFAVTYRYDLDGIVNFDVVDERDQAVLHSGEIALGIQRDRRQMVDIAKRVESTLDEGVMHESKESFDLDAEVATIVLNARNRIAPFLDDDEAANIRDLCERIESSGGTDQGLVDQLTKIVQKYSYLF